MFFTFVFLKPDTLERGLTPSVLARLSAESLSIQTFSYVIVSKEKIFAHYAGVIDQLGEAFKEKVLVSFLNKPVIPVILGSADAKIISKVRKIIGATDPSKAEPGTIRGDFGVDSFAQSDQEGRCCDNLIHASDSVESFYLETALWFGEETAKNYRCY